MKKCPKCGHDNTDEFKFCGNCGLELNNQKICPFCNAENNSEYTFCIKCGKPFNTNATSQKYQQNINNQQVNLNQKISLKSIIKSSLVIALTFIILDNLTGFLNLNIDIRIALQYIYTFLSGIFGIFIFNKMNNKEYPIANIFIISLFGLLLTILFYGLLGGSIGTLGNNILSYILIVIGAIIGNYIQKNANN